MGNKKKKIYAKKSPQTRSSEEEKKRGGGGWVGKTLKRQVKRDLEKGFERANGVKVEKKRAGK